MTQQQKQIKARDRQQEEILEFKNSQMLKKKEIENEANRYKMLLNILGQVRKQGEEDLERQRHRINQKYADLLEEHRKAAMDDAEKGISQIEKNIAIQNIRLEEEANI